MLLKDISYLNANSGHQQAFFYSEQFSFGVFHSFSNLIRTKKKLHYVKHLWRNSIVLLLANIFRFAKGKRGDWNFWSFWNAVRIAFHMIDNESIFRIIITTFSICINLFATLLLVIFMVNWIFVPHFVANGICKCAVYDYFNFPACFRIVINTVKSEEKVQLRAMCLCIALCMTHMATHFVQTSERLVIQLKSRTNETTQMTANSFDEIDFQCVLKFLISLSKQTMHQKFNLIAEF